MGNDESSTVYDDSELFPDWDTEHQQVYDLGNLDSSFAFPENENSMSPSNSDDSSISNNDISNEKTNKKRGRAKNKNLPYHTKFKNDCRLAKIQTSYFNFLIILLNTIMKKKNLKYRFIQINGKYKSNISQKFRASLNQKSIKEIIMEAPISPKYRKMNQNHNINVINQLIKEGDPTLLEVLEKNFLFFFNIYYCNERKFNLSSFELNPCEVNLAPNVNLFKDLLNKNKSDSFNIVYKKEMEKCAIKYFLI